MKHRLLQALIPAQILFLLTIGMNALAAPGDVDATYGQHGRALFNIPGNNFSWANGFFQQSDGKTVAVGFARDSVTGNRDFLVVRFNTDGSLDTSFNTIGYVRIDFDNVAFDDYATAGVQQLDNKLLIVGTRSTTNTPGNLLQMGVLRLNENGSLDTTFDGDGRAILGLGADSDLVGVDVHLQSSGAIVLAGWGETAAPTYNFVFARLSAINGGIDGTYGNGGIAFIDLGATDVMLRAVRQTDDKIVAVGYSSGAGGNSMAAARITADGVLDTNFGDNGRLVSSPCGGFCQWSGVAQQPDGKLILSGYRQLPPTANSPGLPQEQSVVSRYNINGTIDSTFGTSGQIVGLFAGYSSGASTLAGERAIGTVVDPTTGAITILGNSTSRIYGVSGSVVASISVLVGRVSALGVLDASFGKQGTTSVPFGSQTKSFNDFGAGTILRQSDGKLLVLSRPGMYVNTVPTLQSVAVARLTATGGDPGIISMTTANPIAKTIGNALVRLLRGGGTSGPVSVSYATMSGTALAGVDFTTTSGTVTWADGDGAVKLVSVPIIATNVGSSDKTFSIVLSNPSGGAEIDITSGNVMIAQDSVPPTLMLNLSQTAITATESAGSVSVTVSRTGTAQVSVIYYLADGSAKLGSDFSSSSGVLGWATGDTSTRTLTIPIANDTIGEPSESFSLILTGAGSGAVYGSHATAVTITDDDPPQVSFSAATASVSEAQSSVTLSVTRSGTTTQNLSVNYATSNGTATSGSDYTATTATLTWAPTDADTKTITIPLVADSTYEGNESFTVTLSGPTGGATLGTSSTTVTILEDDAAPLPAPPPSSGGGGRIDLAWLLILALLATLRRRLWLPRKVTLPR